MSKTPKWALEKIKEAKEKRLEELDLDCNEEDEKLAEIPAEVFELEQLKILSLKYNLLTSIPDSISQLRNLTKLRLGCNQLTSIPKSISELKRITYLGLQKNKLTVFPESITQLQNLTEAYLWGNEYSCIPESIAQLKELIKLHIDARSRSIPEAIYRLSSLKRLSLPGKQITEISSKIQKLENLEELDLEGNPIKTPPPEVVGGYDKLLRIEEIEKIKNYFRQLEKEGKDYLYEAKSVIVGDGWPGLLFRPGLSKGGGEVHIR